MLDELKDLEAKKKTPLFLYHGDKDQMINHRIAMMTYKELQDKGFNLNFEVEDYLDHSVSIPEI